MKLNPPVTNWYLQAENWFLNYSLVYAIFINRIYDNLTDENTEATDVTCNRSWSIHIRDNALRTLVADSIHHRHHHRHSTLKLRERSRRIRTAWRMATNSSSIRQGVRAVATTTTDPQRSEKRAVVARSAAGALALSVVALVVQSAATATPTWGYFTNPDGESLLARVIAFIN